MPTCGPSRAEPTRGSGAPHIAQRFAGRAHRGARSPTQRRAGAHTATSGQPGSDELHELTRIRSGCQVLHRYFVVFFFFSRYAPQSTAGAAARSARRTFQQRQRSPPSNGIPAGQQRRGRHCRYGSAPAGPPRRSSGIGAGGAAAVTRSAAPDPPIPLTTEAEVAKLAQSHRGFAEHLLEIRDPAGKRRPLASRRAALRSAPAPHPPGPAPTWPRPRTHLLRCSRDMAARPRAPRNRSGWKRRARWGCEAPPPRLSPRPPPQAPPTLHLPGRREAVPTSRGAGRARRRRTSWCPGARPAERNAARSRLRSRSSPVSRGGRSVPARSVFPRGNTAGIRCGGPGWRK